MFPVSVLSQDNFFTVDDYNGLSQIYFDHINYGEDSYVLGGTVCSTGECGVLSRYGNEGELIFLKEIDNIDVNSHRCLGLRGGTIILTGLSKYEVGARLQMYSLDGKLLMDNLVNRDDNLVYTWPVDALYLEEYFYLVVNENYDNEPRQTAVYKVDYGGNVLDYVRLPYYHRGEIYTLTQLGNGNLFVSRPYLDDDLCAFEHGEPDRPNAVIFYEISADSLEIIREKQNVCYRSTRNVSYDSRVLSNGTIVRNILWKDSIDDKIIHAANIYYDSDWEEIGIDMYPQVIFGNSLIGIGVLGNRTYASKDSTKFYVAASISYPQPDEDFPYINFLIQKWDINRNLMWERVVSDPNIHHRIYFNSLFETESQIVLSGYVWSDFDVGGTQDFAIMSLDPDGCYNGDCSDTIYLNGPPTSVFDAKVDTDISISPNPVLDEIVVRASSPLRSITCYTLDGTMVLRETLFVMEHTLDFGILPSGMYVVRVVSDDGISIQKVMKL